MGAFRKSCFTQHRSVEQIKLTQDTESDKELPKPSPRLWDSRHTLKSIRRQDFDKKSNYSLLDEPGIAQIKESLRRARDSSNEGIKVQKNVKHLNRFYNSKSSMHESNGRFGLIQSRNKIDGHIVQQDNFTKESQSSFAYLQGPFVTQMPADIMVTHTRTSRRRIKRPADFEDPKKLQRYISVYENQNQNHKQGD